MASFMASHFRWYGWICRTSGVLFLQNLQSTKEDIKLAWKTSYLFYSLACLAVFMFIQILYFFLAAVVVFAQIQDFTKSLYVIVYTVVSLKVLLNVSFMTVKSTFLLDFFRESAKYEKQVRFLTPTRCNQSNTCYVIRSLLAMTFLANVTVNSYFLFEVIDGLQCNEVLSLFVKIVSIAGNCLFYVYEMLHFVVLRPCIEVFSLYIRHQHEVAESVVNGCSGEAFAKRARKIEEVRLNLCAIAGLKERINSMWRWSIVASGVTTLLISCICFYSTFAEKNFSTVQHLAAVFYTISSCLDFFDIAGLSQAMVKELRELRKTLHSAPVFLEDGAYFNQISYLRDAIKPKEIALSGAEFFSLNLPLVVSLAGTIITYTVILVQTSESVK